MLYPLLYFPFRAYRGVRRALLLAHRAGRSLLPFLLWITSEVLMVASLALGGLGFVLLAIRVLGTMDPGPLPDLRQWRVFLPALAWIGVGEIIAIISDELLDAHDKLTGAES